MDIKVQMEKKEGRRMLENSSHGEEGVIGRKMKRPPHLVSSRKERVMREMEGGGERGPGWLTFAPGPKTGRQK